MSGSVSRFITRLLDRPAIWKESAYASAGLFALLVVLAVWWPTNLILKPINSWNVFHYVLGTKYFDEIGYFDFYYGTILADLDGERVFDHAPFVRDLRTYLPILRKDALAKARASGVRKRFSKARWAEFKRDLRTIQRLRSPRGWAGPLTDRGYNPSPVWLIVHRPLLNAVDVHKKSTLMLLCYAQIFLYVLTFAVAWWAFGGRYTLIGGLFFVVYFGNLGLKLGGYFSHDWFCATICAVSLYRKGYHLAAGPVLAYAATMRGYPGLLALYPVVAIISRAVRWRLPEGRHVVFLGALALSSLVFVGLGCLNGRGVGAWTEWKDKIVVHDENQRLSPNEVGLQSLFAHDYETGRWIVRPEERKEAVSRYEPAYRVVSLIFVALTLLAMLRRDDHEGMVLGIAVGFATMMASRYYFSVGVLLFTLSALDRRRIGNWAGGLWLFLLVAVFYIQRFVIGDPVRKYYLCFNLGLGLYFLAILGNFLVRDGVWLWRRLMGRGGRGRSETNREVRG